MNSIKSIARRILPVFFIIALAAMPVFADDMSDERPDIIALPGAGAFTGLMDDVEVSLSTAPSTEQAFEYNAFVFFDDEENAYSDDAKFRFCGPFEAEDGTMMMLYYVLSAKGDLDGFVTFSMPTKIAEVPEEIKGLVLAAKNATFKIASPLDYKTIPGITTDDISPLAGYTYRVDEMDVAETIKFLGASMVTFTETLNEVLTTPAAPVDVIEAAK